MLRLGPSASLPLIPRHSMVSGIRLARLPVRRPPLLGQRRGSQLRVQAALGDPGSSPPMRDIRAWLEEVYKRVQPVADALVGALQTTLALQRQWVQRAWARTVLAWAIALGVATAAANAWGLPAINARLPAAAAQVATLLQRDVSLGRVRWLAPTGITGLHPLGCVGPVAVGSGPVEGSSAELQNVMLGVDPLRSILRGRIVLTVKASGAEVHLKQGNNYSWFGFPDDTEPTSRDFVPGLNQQQQQQQSAGKGKGGKGGGSGGEGGSSSSGGGGGGGGARAVEVPAPTAESFLASVANELLAWHAAQDRAAQGAITAAAADATPDVDAAQSLVLLSVGAPPGTVSAPAEQQQKSMGWRSLLPFQSGAQKGAKAAKEDAQRRARARQQQLDALNSIKFSMRGAPQQQATQSQAEADLKAEEEEVAVAETVPTAEAAEPAAEQQLQQVEEPAEPAKVVSGQSSRVNAALKPVSADPARLFHAEAEPALPMPETVPVDATAHEAPSQEAEPEQPHLQQLLMPSNRAASLLNDLPALIIDIRAKQPAQAPAEPEVPEQPPEPSPAARAISSLDGVALGEMSPPAAALQASPTLSQFKSAVLDQATERKKALGSKALQKARNWKPAKAPAPSAASLATAQADADAAATPALADISVAAPQGAADDLSEEAAHADQKTHAHGHKVHITHPGYFPPATGPIYTPAPPEALAELRAKQRTLMTLVKQLAGAAGALVQRSLVLGQVEISAGTLYGHIHGEELPRVFENVAATVSLGSNYDTLDVDITALPRERDPASIKCTMPNPNSHRHLRDFTGIAALAAREAEAAGIASPTLAGAAGVEDVSDATGAAAGPPTGGHVRVLVKASGLSDNDLAVGGPRVPDMTITVRGRDLHAPLVERIFELPMDINAGRANGEFIIRMHNYATWHAPEYHGRVAVRGADFHFWDATDDILDADLDLLFEGDRLYLHRASGRFGAVPMTLTGDLDLNPLTGRYRLSATVPGVEINALRATLGVRPTPFPVAGAVAGTLHVTGPLEKPVFSGHARVVRPGPEALADAEPTAALTALLSEDSAVGAYDRVPVASAELVFSLDTATERMTLHEFRASPVGGGELHGSGTLGVSPAAETDPAALSVTATGSGLPAEALAARYLPDGAQIPPGLVVGPASASLTMRGAHLAPVIDVDFSMPEGSVAGAAQFTREATSLRLSSPNLDGSGTVFLRPPSFEAAKAAVTQAQATALARPDVSGCDADVTMRGLDIVPLVSDEASRRALAQQSGEPVRLKVNGRARVAGSVSRPDAAAAAAEPWQFDGTLDLEDVKLNQLKLYRALKGSLKLSEKAVVAHARGVRPDEALDVELSLPLLPEALPEPVVEALDGDEAAEETQQAQQGSSVSVRCGQLLAAATVDAAGSQLDVRVANVKLDELELASLRGELQEVSCSLNFQNQTGRGRVALSGPRYSGLVGDSLSGGFRWERDVVRLERLVLQQRRSRYEVQGEYVVPPSVALPTSAADLARRQVEQQRARAEAEAGGAAAPLPVPGRWRLRVDVPAADMQEILPAARLLQSATSQRPADYERAKAAFISAVTDLSLKAEGLHAQLCALAEKMASGQEASKAAAAAAPAQPAFHLPALQDVHGHWSGSVQAFGGGGGATSCEFDVRGGDWQWGQATLDAVVANGNYHSEEGVQLQELVLTSGDAKLLVRGSLLSEHQDATVLLTDFPMTKLRPLFRAIPALKNAAPAASGPAPEPIPSPLPLGMLAKAVGQASRGLQAEESDSPINGMLYVSGTLSGSKDAPTGEVAVRLFDAAVGPTRLAQAQASARLSESRLMTFNVDVVPVEGHRKSGHIRAAGSVPLDGNASDSGDMDVRLSVRDSGMAVLTSVAPDFRWKSGEADVSFRLTGSLEQPAVTGAATVSKAVIDCPVLKYPLEVVTADVRCAEGMLEVESMDARVGRKGHVRARGALPVYQSKTPARGAAPVLAAMQHRLTLDVGGLELRLRNIYTGQMDALVTVRDSVERPMVGGSLRFSRGAVYLIPQEGAPGAPGAAAPGAAPAGPTVAKVFDLLTRRESGLAARLEDVVRQEVEAVEHMVEDAAGPNLALDALALQFGPDLRAVYPLVMNFGVTGELVVSGPAHPDAVSVEGALRLPGGDVNLVATQLELDREHANTLTFGGGGTGGIDPLVDVVLTSGDLRLSVRGRASEWASHVVMQTAGGASAGGEAGEQLDATEAARLLEDKLKAALLADDGQLALSRLAGSTVSTLMPKIETQGVVGGARWRLVSAPAIPGLLDPLASDPSILGAITMGTEVEVQFGRKLQATMVRKLRESDVNTQWTFNYLLNSKLRMQFSVSSASPYHKTLMFQFQSSEGSGA